MSTSTSVFIKEILINGKPTRVECVEIHGQTYSLFRGLATTVPLEDEWYGNLNDLDSIIAALRHGTVKGDIFTFWQRLSEIERRFDFHTEWESIAVLPVTTFNHWWSKQIKPETRNLVRKALERSVEVREAACDDDAVRGMTEVPLRRIHRRRPLKRTHELPSRDRCRLTCHRLTAFSLAAMCDTRLEARRCLPR